MKRLLEEYFSKESQAFLQYKQFNRETKLNISAELERWTMRCEELESSLFLMGECNYRLTLLVKDFQKALMVKNKHIQEQAEAAEAIKTQLVRHNEFLSGEIELLKQEITQQIIPRSESLILNSLSGAHQTIHHLKRDHNSVSMDLSDKNRVVEELEEVAAALKSNLADVSERHEEAMRALNCIQMIMAQ